MPSAVQVIHRLHGQQYGELLAGLFLRYRQAELELATAPDHVLEHLIDRVLVDARPARDDAPDLTPESGDELRRGAIARVLRRIREDAAQVAIVEIRVIHAVVLTLGAIVLVQRLGQLPQRIGLLDVRQSG